MPGRVAAGVEKVQYRLNKREVAKAGDQLEGLRFREPTRLDNQLVRVSCPRIVPVDFGGEIEGDGRFFADAGHTPRHFHKWIREYEQSGFLWELARRTLRERFAIIDGAAED